MPSIPSSPTSRLRWRDTVAAIARVLGLAREPVLDWPFSEENIAHYHAAKKSPADISTDDQTWRDLGVAAYRDNVADTVSIFGRQMLHHRLRAGTAPAALIASVSRVESLLADREFLSVLGTTLTPLRELDTEISALLFDRKPEALPQWVGVLWLLPLALIACVLAILFTPFLTFAVLAMLGTIVLIMAAQNVMRLRVELWNREAKSLRYLLARISVLGELARTQNCPAIAEFTALADQASEINRAITPAVWLDVIPGAADYAEWYLLSNIRHYANSLRTIEKHREFLQRCFEQLANLAADMALASHLQQAAKFCWATPANGRTLSFTAVVHPLLREASPLSIALDARCAIVTGQNAIGKSTLLKAIGLNLMSSRAFGFCYAEAATTPRGAIYASLNNEDSLSGGESLYIAELRRARELLEACKGVDGGVCLIDEIFQGTNHIEAVAAAGAFLHALAPNALVVVSSHHTVLAALLTNAYSPLCLSKSADVPAGLTLQAGVLSEPSGISLLRTQGFDANVEENARRIAAWFAGFLAEPKSADGVLKP